MNPDVVLAWLATVGPVDDTIDWYADAQGRCQRGMWSVPDGWSVLVAEMAADLARIAPGYVVAQAKEKFSTLSFYATPNLAADAPAREVRGRLFDARIRVACNRSAQTCEACGAPGWRRTRGTAWMRTLCGRCATTGTYRGQAGLYGNVAAHIDTVFDTPVGAVALEGAAEHRDALDDSLARGVSEQHRAAITEHRDQLSALIDVLATHPEVDEKP